MFERYTEKARRAIFFARYEASQLGSPFIETEHLLMGLLREDRALANRFLRSHASIDSIRKQIEAHTTLREKVSTTVDLPLSQECKQVLAYAAEEAERLAHKHIGTEHLLLGLLREDKTFAAEILHEGGLRLAALREEISRVQDDKGAAMRVRESSLLAEFGRDLTQAAMDDQLDPLIGRENEYERLVQILSRRSSNNPVLIGEPGVGKTAVVRGLAQRIADGDVPAFLSDKRILALDLGLIVAGTKYRGQFEERLKTIVKELLEVQGAIIFIDELQTLVGAGSWEGSMDAAEILKPALSRGEIQAICETTPSGYRKSIEKAPWLANCSQVVNVPPLEGADAIKVLFSVKDRFENYHAVTYTDEAITAAVYYSERYIPDRYLPAKASDLIDEAGARVKLRQSQLPQEMIDVQKRIKFITHRMTNAIVNHEFEKARFYSDEERKERETLHLLREKHNVAESAMGVVTREEIEVVVASWPSVPKDFIAANSNLFYSCFISYSSKDQEFAERLRADLLTKGVRCWFAPEDLKIGDKFRTRIDESIRSYDKLLIVLSENSIQSPWVENEVEAASERERQQNKPVLFPIRLDDSIMESPQAWAATIRRERHIGDFREWKNVDAFKKAFERLLRDLKAGEPASGT